MTFEARQRTLQYKRATFLNGSGNLEQMLTAAFKRFADVNDREETLVEGAKSFRVVSSPGRRHGMMSGRLLLYTPGQRQSLLERDETNKDYVLSTEPPPKGKGDAKREFVESILYFAAKDNHLMILGSVALNPRSLENHLNWLLDKAGQIQEAENGLLLADQPSKDAQKKLTAYPVKAIQFGSRLQFGRPDVKDAGSGSKKITKIEPIGDAAHALAAYLGKWFGGRKLNEAFNNENIKVTLTVKYVSHEKSEEGFELMEQLAVAGRHFDKNDCVIRLAGGGKVKGDELKVSAPFEVRIAEDGLVIEADLWANMSAWLQAKIRVGLVPTK